ncbi:MAG: hypothetical protein HY909_27700 [Deltaproteobacteria bacterium]|nr:hypothetical protein [Deltaproteobacteria bacterium]
MEGPRRAVVATLTEEGTLPAPLTVRLQAPMDTPQCGLQATWFPGGAGTVHTMECVLTTLEVPSTDLVMYVETRAPGFGARGEHRHGFGRPGPSGPRPVAAGRPLVLGGVPAGPSVLVSPPRPGGPPRGR